MTTDCPSIVLSDHRLLVTLRSHTIYLLFWLIPLPIFAQPFADESYSSTDSLSEACSSEGIQKLSFERLRGQGWSLIGDLNESLRQSIGEVILHVT